MIRWGGGLIVFCAFSKRDFTHTGLPLWVHPATIHVKGCCITMTTILDWDGVPGPWAVFWWRERLLEVENDLLQTVQEWDMFATLRQNAEMMVDYLYPLAIILMIQWFSLMIQLFNLMIQWFTLWFNDSILGFNDSILWFNDSILGFNDSILGFNDSLYDSMIQF
jgi:hypothetical protein